MRLIDAELLKSRLSERIRTKRSTMEILKDIFPIIDNMPSVKSDSDELQEYREIGTAQECREAIQMARACQKQYLDDQSTGTVEDQQRTEKRTVKTAI